MKDVITTVNLPEPEKPAREGWAEASREVADAGDDKLVWPEFNNAEDVNLAWELTEVCMTMKNKKDRLLLFLDTEFTDFKDIDLISIGIVSQDLHEFYAENAEYDYSKCNDFVKSEVVTKLQGGEYKMLYGLLKEKLQLWLSDLLEEYATVLFVFDYSGDWFLLGELLIDYPHREKVKGQQDELEAGIELYFMHDRSNEHHALHDAKALFNGFKVKYAGKDSGY